MISGQASAEGANPQAPVPAFNALRIWDRTYTRKLHQVARGQIFRHELHGDALAAVLARVGVKAHPSDRADWVAVVVEHLADTVVVRLADTGGEVCLPRDLQVEIPAVPLPLGFTP